MNKIEKNNSIKNRKRKLNKEYFLVYILELVGFFGGQLIYATAAIYVFPLVAVVLSLLKLDIFLYSVIMSGMNLFFRSIPIFVLILCEAKKEVIDDKIKNLDVFDDVETVKKIKKVSKKEKERQEILFEEIVSKIEKLPREMQVDILNYIKDDLISNSKEIGIRIDMLSEDNIEILQDRIQDILYPDFSKDDDFYTRCRKK